MHWLYIAGVALLLWKLRRIGHPFIVFEIYLLISALLAIPYQPYSDAYWRFWAWTQPFVLLLRVAVVVELWWYATLGMFDRKRWGVLLLTFMIGAAWILFSWDVVVYNGDAIRTIGHLRNRLSIGLVGMLIGGALYIWSEQRPVRVERNTIIHGAILFVHFASQVMADALWAARPDPPQKYFLDAFWWQVVNYSFLLINLGCLLTWGLHLRQWSATDARARSVQRGHP